MINPESTQFFKQIFGGSWITQGISVAAQLGIADLLADGPRTVEELAQRTGAHSGSLYRLLRALASVGIFAQGQDRRFALTPLADRLRRDGEGSQQAYAIMMGTEFYRVWGELLHSVRTGEHGFMKAFGKPAFQYMTEHPERHATYDAAMADYGKAESEAMLDAYDFSGLRTVMDVGGGNGLMLAAILNRHPAIQGILFDLPAVVDRARSIIASAGLSDRCRVEGGDFFSSVPVGAHAYVMRHVLHDWDDAEAIAILRRCREAMSYDGKVLVVETVIPCGNEPCFGKWLDLMMLLVGGRERTEEEFRQLFSAAGLVLDRIIPTTAEVSVIEGSRKA